MRILIATLLTLMALSGCIGDDGDENTGDTPQNMDQNGDGVVVVAVIDGGFNPYILDMVGSQMPQHLDADPNNDLPLHLPPHEWIDGHPGADGFASYTALSLDYSYAEGDIDESINSNDLHSADSEEWSKVQSSSASNINYHYIPNSKVVGYVNTAGGDGFAASSHGVGTSTVSVGNWHGSCPNCLLVFVNNGGGETASNWVLEQDWIDVQTNSFGYSLVMRDRMYAGSDTQLQKEATENGQAIFFSAGNGQANTFTVPNPTLFSSQEGPDWIVTVGAIDPNGKDSYLGHGKPADVASIGSGYPSGGYCDNTINCTGGFGGTSNATPVTAGMYAQALYELRTADEVTVPRPQNSTFIVEGQPVEGGFLEDGALTTHELLDALFLAAEHKSSGTVLGITGVGAPVETAEMQFLSEGHGSFIGKLHGNDIWAQEVQAIVNATLHGEGEMVPGEEDWFINDSYCRQTIWGEWEHGDYDGTNLPGADPNWPLRQAIQVACPTVIATVVDVEQIKDGGT
ncbi:MAG: S8/S53 family peptidase [Thermoplasmatota archaeon]